VEEDDEDEERETMTENETRRSTLKTSSVVFIFSVDRKKLQSFQIIKTKILSSFAMSCLYLLHSLFMSYVLSSSPRVFPIIISYVLSSSPMSCLYLLQYILSSSPYFHFFILFILYIYIRAVSVNALIYAINLAALTH